MNVRYATNRSGRISLTHSGLLAQLGEDRLFLTVADAVDALS